MMRGLESWSDCCLPLASSLLHLCWVGIVVGLLAAVFERWQGRNTATVRYRTQLGVLVLWGICLPLVVLLQPGATSQPDTVGVLTADIRPVPPDRDVDTRWSEAAPLSFVKQGADLAAPEFGGTEDFGDTGDRPGTPSASLVAASDVPAGVVSRLIGQLRQVAVPVVLIYLAGVMLLLGRLVQGLWRSARLRTSDTPLERGTVFECLQEQADCLALRAVPLVVLCDRVVVPAVAGILKPAVLLPPALVSGLTRAQLEAVLRHELAHIVQRDQMWIVLQRLVESVLFFHPVTWLLGRRLHELREQACDERVLAAGTQPVCYAESLPQVAAARVKATLGKDRLSSLPAADGGDPSVLRRRIAGILGEPVEVRSGNLSLGLLGLAVVIAGTFFLTAGLTTQADDFVAGDSQAGSGENSGAVGAKNDLPPQPQEEQAQLIAELTRLQQSGAAAMSSIRTAHLEFQRTSIHGPFRDGVTAESILKMVREWNLADHPEQQTELIRAVSVQPHLVVQQPWSLVKLYTDRSSHRTDLNTGDVHITGPEYSIRWDVANVQLNVTAAKDNRIWQPGLDIFLQGLSRVPNAAQIAASDVNYQILPGMVLFNSSLPGGGQARLVIDRRTGLFHRMERYDADGQLQRLSWWSDWPDHDQLPALPGVAMTLECVNGQLNRLEVNVVTRARFNVQLPVDIFRLGIPAGAVIMHPHVGVSVGRVNREVFDVMDRDQLQAAFQPLREELTPEERAGVEQARQLYTLAEGEQLKRIRPPFPRARRYLPRLMQRRSADRPGEWSRLVEFDGQQFSHVFMHTNGSLTLESVLWRMLQPDVADLEGPKDLLGYRLPGDIVFSHAAAKQDLQDEMQRLMSEERQRSVRIEVREVERVIYWTDGDFQLQLPPGQTSIELNCGGRRGNYPHIADRGSARELLEAVSAYVGHRIVCRRPLPPGPFHWEQRDYDISSDLVEEPIEFDGETVLRNLTAQTGLQFEQDTEQQRIMFVEYAD